MNFIWASIIIVSFSYSLLTGNLENFSRAMTSGAQDAVNFILSLCGIMAMWSGLMEIAERTGLVSALSRVFLPVTGLLFPGQKDPETLSCIVMSFMSNVFGAGNSSTVFALRTMEKLDQQNHFRPEASNDMCTFAVVNMAFAPILPVVTVQMRQNLGSADPYSVVLPAIISSWSVVLVSVIACKFLERRS